MHQTKSDNLDEIMASYMEHSNIDDLDSSNADTDSSSDLDSVVKVTEVKVVTEIISPDFLDDQSKSSPNSCKSSDASTPKVEKSKPGSGKNSSRKSPCSSDMESDNNSRHKKSRAETKLDKAMDKLDKAMAILAESELGIQGHTECAKGEGQKDGKEADDITSCQPSWLEEIAKMAPYADEESFSIVDGEDLARESSTEADSSEGMGQGNKNVLERERQVNQNVSESRVMDVGEGYLSIHL